MKSCKLCNYVGDDFEPNRFTCRKCRYAYKLETSRTELGHIKKVYHNQKKASKTRGHSMPSYSLFELKDWFLSQDSFRELYTAWKESGYEKWLAPSADRIDNNRGYSLDNIRLMTWQENAQLAHDDCKMGLLSTGHKNLPISQFTKNGQFIKIYPTMREAERELNNKCRKEVKMCCEGLREHAVGYIWKYAGAL